MMDILNNVFDWIEALPVWGLTILVALVIGFTLKKTPRYPNDMIPIGVMAFGTIASVALQYGLGRLIVKGMIYSGLAWLFHRHIWKRFANRFFPEAQGEFDTGVVAVKKVEEVVIVEKDKQKKG